MYSNRDIFDGELHHFVVTSDGTNRIRFYIDGVQDNTSSSFNLGSGIDAPTADITTIGCNGESFQIDEAAFWSRSLTDSEVQELYRRGANRIKYQIKSCVDVNCQCQSYNSAPQGSETDCDGDGVPNNTDTIDSHSAKFLGPGGDGNTFYSELFNRDNSHLTVSCGDNNTDDDSNVCLNDEISVSNSPLGESPNFEFASMATSANPINNRYFQYRVVMESEENTACNSQACTPSLNRVEIGPNPRYFGGSPSITSNTPIPITTLGSIGFQEVGSCTPGYQLSADGITFYYFDGSNWTIAANDNTSMTTTSSQVQNNLQSLGEQLTTGSLYFRAFLPSDTTQSCQINQISITE